MLLLLMRCLLIVALAVVIVASFQGIWWLAFPPRRAKPSVQVKPFDMIKGGEIRKGQAEMIARLLVAKMKRIDGVLTTDLSRFKPPPEIRLESVTPKALVLGDVASPLVFEFKPFNFDVVGILNYVSDLLRDGPVIQGGALIGDKEVEILAEYQGSGDGTIGSAWTAKSDKGLDDTLEALAHRAVWDMQRTSNPQIAQIDASDFRTFVEALADYQAYVRESGPGLRSPGSPRLLHGLQVLKPLADRGCSSGLVFSYLGSIYMEMDRPEEALHAFEQAQARMPDDGFVGRTLRTVRGVVASKSAVGPPPQGNVPISPDRVLDQPALLKVGVPAAIREAGGGADLAVAVLGTGGSPPPSIAGQFLQGRSFVPGQPAEDRNGHGTSVASLVAVVAPHAQILPVKVLSDEGTGTDSEILEGIEYALTQKARVIIVPLGAPGIESNPVYQQVFRRVRDAGALPIVAAGNQGSDQPNSLTFNTGALGVAATDSDDRLAPFSNFGPGVSLAGPGENILTLAPPPTHSKMFSGTSFSAAIVGGVAALVFSSRPDLDDKQVEAILKETAVDLGAVDTRLKGIGRVDALAAVRKAKAYPKRTGSVP